MKKHNQLPGAQWQTMQSRMHHVSLRPLGATIEVKLTAKLTKVLQENFDEVGELLIQELKVIDNVDN